jgi:PTH1 family peptidyl-tRNA hydrolase
MLDDLFAKLFPKKQTVTGPVEFIVVGLGNPGAEYEDTRHNAGFLAVDHIAAKYGAKVSRVKFKSYTGECVIGGRKVLLMKPATYMNKSGEAAQEALSFHKLPSENLIVLYDEIALPPGTLRIRASGSAGGHNGMKNIIYLTGLDNFPRVRIGIGGKPHPDMELSDWVLGRFTKPEAEAVASTFEAVAGAVEMIVGGEILQAMAKFNKRHIGPPQPEGAGRGTDEGDA